MTLFPLVRRLRSYQGPHVTCTQTAETHNKRYARRNNDTMFDCFMYRSITYGHLRFLIYFSSGFFTIVAFVFVSLSFLIGYCLMHLFLRFQYKITIFLLLLGRRGFAFNDLNKFLVYCLHLMMVFIGGFGWVFMLFVEM